MATILPFEARNGATAGGSPQKGPATIVIFPGVRYERGAGQRTVEAAKAAEPQAGPAKH